MAYQFSFERYEMKYLLTPQQKSRMLDFLSPFMSIDSYGRSTIRNIYYDTPDFLLIRRSLEKPVYKEKFRIRSYALAKDNSTVFVEIKKKYKSVVYKRRIALPCAVTQQAMVTGEALPDNSQIGKEIAWFRSCYPTMQPQVFISYEREAYAPNKDAPVPPDFRVTFDENILFRRDDLDLRSEPYGELVLPQDITLMELKIAGAMPFCIARALSEFEIMQSTFSKYGTVYQKHILREVYYA